MWDCSPSGGIITKEFGLVKKQVLEPRGKDKSSVYAKLTWSLGLLFLTGGMKRRRVAEGNKP